MAQDPQSREMVIAIVAVFTTLPLLFVGLRLWARKIKLQAFLADDYLVLAAAVK